MSGNHPSIIIDEQGIVPLRNITILENESSGEPGSSRKCVFKAVLQTLEEKNQNNRIYSMEIGREIVAALKPKAKARSLYMEVDHPLIIVNSQDDPMSVKRRMVTVSMNNAGAMLRDIYIEGKNIIGEVETLSGFKGPDIFNLIVNDKANVGFSLRMFGREVKGSNGVIGVEKPIKPITFDIVSNPSHGTARVMEFLPEDANQLAAELDKANILLEGEGQGDFCSSNHVREYVNSLIFEAYGKQRLVVFKL
jgi:hypothetical protein